MNHVKLSQVELSSLELSQVGLGWIETTWFYSSQGIFRFGELIRIYLSHVKEHRRLLSISKYKRRLRVEEKRREE